MNFLCRRISKYLSLAQAAMRSVRTKATIDRTVTGWPPSIGVARRRAASISSTVQINWHDNPTNFTQTVIVLQLDGKWVHSNPLPGRSISSTTPSRLLFGADGSADLKQIAKGRKQSVSLFIVGNLSNRLKRLVQ